MRSLRCQIVTKPYWLLAGCRDMGDSRYWKNVAGKVAGIGCRIFYASNLGIASAFS